MLAAATNIKALKPGPVWNLGLVKAHEGLYRIVMPEPTGEFDAEQVRNWPDHSLTVHWPVNPHFTGAAGIACMLQAIDRFKGCAFDIGDRVIYPD